MRLKNWLKRKVRTLFDLLPSNSAYLAGLFRSYIDRFEAENNSDFHSNGEAFFLRQNLPHIRVVFDVGANVGEWAAYALGLNPDIEMHCFEPSRPTYTSLVDRVGSRAHCNNFGLGSTTEERTLHIFEKGSGLNSLYRRAGLERWNLRPPSDTETVQLKTLDSYCLAEGVHQIDYLKLDVEGHEIEVLRGAMDMLREGRIVRIQFEYGGCNIDSRTLLKDFFELLSPHGFQLHKLYPTSLKHISRYDQALENFQYQNWVAIQQA